MSECAIDRFEDRLKPGVYASDKQQYRKRGPQVPRLISKSSKYLQLKSPTNVKTEGAPIS